MPRVLFWQRLIGRTDRPNGPTRHTENVIRAAQLARAHGVKFKLNTVVCESNKMEDMTSFVQLVKPSRWKVFQVRSGYSDLNNSKCVNVIFYRF